MRPTPQRPKQPINTPTATGPTTIHANLKTTCRSRSCVKRAQFAALTGNCDTSEFIPLGHARGAELRLRALPEVLTLIFRGALPGQLAHKPRTPAVVRRNTMRQVAETGRGAKFRGSGRRVSDCGTCLRKLLISKTCRGGSNSLEADHSCGTLCGHQHRCFGGVTAKRCRHDHSPAGLRSYCWGGFVEGNAREFLGDAPDPVCFGVVS